MATFDQFNKNFRKNLAQAIDQALNQTTLKETGDFLSNQIRVRTRTGRGVEENGAVPQSLVPLTPGYVNFRRNFTRLSSATSPRKSNLTLTGQMLDSIDYTTDNRTKLITFSFSNVDSILKAEYVSGKRPFFNASRGDITEITRRWNDKIARELVNISFNK